MHNRPCNTKKESWENIFPYSCRGGQKEFFQCAKTSQDTGKTMIWQGPTGTGKTVCALTTCIHYSQQKGKKILYLTRTNSQQTQVLLEARAIREKGTAITVCGLQGRQRWCPVVGAQKNLQGGTPEELSRVCGRKKKLAREGKPGGCEYFTGLRNMDRGEFLEWMSEHLPTSEEISERLVKNGICPYEAVKEFLPDADVVAAPYVYFFEPMVRKSLLENMRTGLEDMIVVVDEAHNLPDYARGIASSSLSTNTVQRALKEAEEYGDPVLADERRAKDVCKALEETITSLVREYCGREEDALIPSGEFQATILSLLSCTSNTLCTIIEGLYAIGDRIRMERLDKGKLPRSHLHSLGAFLDTWNLLEEEEFVHLAVSEPPSLEIYCPDPRLAAKPLNKTAWSLHMSGTLRPLDEYRDTMGLEGAFIHSSSSPFPPENRVTLLAEDVTTKYDVWLSDVDNMNRMKEYAWNIQSLGLNTAFFFPSFSIMDQCVEEGFFRGVERLFVENRGMSQRDLMSSLRDYMTSGGIIAAVVGGRLSEGIDFPGSTLEVVVLVGLPYSRPSARQESLIRHYDRRLLDGWRYAVESPMQRKTLQTLGRLIRDEKDVGAAVLLDARAKKISHLLGDFKNASSPTNMMSTMQDFFEDKS